MHSLPLDSLFKKLAAAAGVFAISVFLLLGLNWGVSNSAATRAESRELADALVGWSSLDPQTHFASAVFAARDLSEEAKKASLAGFENAVALAPRNYLLWIEYGRALERAGEPDRASQAFDRAAELAPSYSAVAWARGNFLVRQGRADAGFLEIRRAVKGNSSYATAAAQLAWVTAGLDVERAIQLAGGEPALSAALALVVARSGNLDAAVRLWQAVPADQRKVETKDIGLQLARLFLDKMRVRDARNFEAEALGKEPSRTFGQPTDPGFEEFVGTENTALFAWKIGGGTNPSINLFDTVKRSGRFSLFLRFAGAGDQQSLRQLSQTVAVEPGVSYRFKYHYRAELTTNPEIRWSVAAISTKALLGTGPPLNSSTEWAEGGFRFTVPGDTDGVVITLSRDACTGTPCRTEGNLWLDDVELIREN
ncbi:MAG: tetratricopeptide repeat protein [Acidobacteria bacterium]|nr:tetratricopeptide repeat protein [Acidobacteriota bacterium]